MSDRDDWGARIRTWDHGTKTRCLTTWPRPRATGTLAAVEEEIHKPEDGKDHDGHDHGPFHDPGEDDPDHGQELRGSEDPQDLANDLGTVLAAAEPGEHPDDRKHDHGPLGQVVRDENEERLGSGDPECESRPPFLKPQSSPAR